MKSSKSSSFSTSSFPFLAEAGGALYIRVRVRPRASKNSIAGIHGETLAVSLTSPPVEGEANKALLKLLAKALHVKKSQVTIASGDKAREKRLKVEGLSLEEAERILARELGL